MSYPWDQGSIHPKLVLVSAGLKQPFQDWKKETPGLGHRVNTTETGVVVPAVTVMLLV